MDNFFTCEEIASRYKVEVSTVWAWIREKKLCAVKVGREYRIRESDLVEFEKRNETV